MGMAYTRSVTRSSVWGTIRVVQSHRKHESRATEATIQSLWSLRSPGPGIDTGLEPALASR